MARRKSAEVSVSVSDLEASQRLHARDLNYAYLVGLFEGDGYFSISKKGQYLTYELGIEVSIRDVQLIYKVKNLLGVGIISFREKNGIKLVGLRIRNKNHLKEYIFPIFDKYPMFSNKQYDYLRFRSCLLSNFIYYENLPIYVKSNKCLNNIKTIIESHYFSAWLVGFIEAEGCFSIYKLNTNGDMVASFYISQTEGYILISAIQKYLSLGTSIYTDNTNNANLKVTNVRYIENIIKFINNAPVKLIGYKKLQYLLWIKQLRKIDRYSNKISIPFKY